MESYSKHSLIIAGLILYFAGCTTDSGEAIPSSNVPHNETLSAAVNLKNAEDGRTAAVGSGESMAPLYGNNTMIVTHPVPFADLKAGMIVAYRGRDGRRIVHKLAYHNKAKDEWVAVGINNPSYDPDPVTPDNYIGVVYGVFNSQGYSTP